MVTLGSFSWLLHGLAMLLAVGGPLALGLLDQGSSASSPTDLIFIAYGFAILFALAGSGLFGLAAMWAAEEFPLGPRKKITSAMYFLHAVLAGVGLVSYGWVTFRFGSLGSLTFDEDQMNMSVIVLSASWLLASVVLVPATIRSLAMFSGPRPARYSPAPLRMTLPAHYSIVNLVGVSLLVVILMKGAIGNTLFTVTSGGTLAIVYDSGFLVAAFIGLIAAPIVATVAFAHLLIRTLAHLLIRTQEFLRRIGSGGS